MTLFDTVFLILAVLDVILVASMVLAALWIRDTMMRGRRQAEPALQEARAVAGTGKAIVERSRREGEASYHRVKGVVEKVRHRLATTRRIAGEVVEPARKTALAARETAGTLRRANTAVVERTVAARDVAVRLGRVKSAAQAAVHAARREP